MQHGDRPAAGVQKTVPEGGCRYTGKRKVAGCTAQQKKDAFMQLRCLGVGG